MLCIFANEQKSLKIIINCQKQLLLSLGIDNHKIPNRRNSFPSAQSFVKKEPDQSPPVKLQHLHVSFKLLICV